MADDPRDASAPVDFVAAFASAAAEVASTIPSCDLGLRVPSCPGWSAYDLVTHLGNVHGWAASIVETGRSAAAQDDRPPSYRSRTVARWYAGKAEDLLQVLRAARAEDACWTFSAFHHTKAFWPRRQTHETLMHLVDLNQAARRPTDIPPRLAADGVAEVLEVFLPRMHGRGRPAAVTAPVLLNATDTGDTWLVAPPDGEPRSRPAGPPVVTRPASPDPPGRGVDTVAAPAAELMLLLWKRLTTRHPAVTLDGNRRRLLDFLRSPLTP